MIDEGGGGIHCILHARRLATSATGAVQRLENRCLGKSKIDSLEVKSAKGTAAPATVPFGVP